MKNRHDFLWGFGLIGLIIAVSVIAFLAGGGLYVREWKSRQKYLASGG